MSSCINTHRGPYVRRSYVCTYVPIQYFCYPLSTSSSFVVYINIRTYCRIHTTSSNWQSFTKPKIPSVVIRKVSTTLAYYTLGWCCRQLNKLSIILQWQQQQRQQHLTHSHMRPMANEVDGLARWRSA